MHGGTIKALRQHLYQWENIQCDWGERQKLSELPATN